MSTASGASAAPTTSSTSTESTPTETTSTGSGPDSTSPSSAAPDGATPDGATSTSTSPIISVTEGAQRTLVLADAFSPGKWTEGSYQPAGTATHLQAMAAKLYCSDVAVMEYRFAPTVGTFRVDVAQSMDSATSDGTVEFSLVADGRQQQTKSIKFTERQQLDTDMAGVTVIKISATQTTSSCSNDVTALVTNVSIAGS